jgi:hypothetical protein
MQLYCPACSAPVDATATQCPSCPAVFTANEGWKPTENRSAPQFRRLEPAFGKPTARYPRVKPASMDRIRVIGVTLIGTSALMAGSGAIVPVLGLLIAAMAPNAFLLGLGMVVLSIVRKKVSRADTAQIAAVAITALLAVNTRLPSIVFDAFGPDQLQLLRHLSAAVGHPLHIETNASELTGRRFPYDSVAPACYGDGCFMTRGFHGPITGITQDYWRENIVDTVLAAGFSRASANEKAPRLLISSTRSGKMLLLEMDLKDKNGGLLAHFRGTFRNGYPLETEDDGVENLGLPGVLQYLLHGNSLSHWLSRLTRPRVEPPLQTFLKTTTKLVDPQANGIQNASAVSLEILSEKLYEPVWTIRDQDDGTPKWSDLAFDKPRHDYCRELMRAERAEAGLTESWMLFKADPTGRKKIRATGELLCETDGLWAFDYAAENGKMIVTRYSAVGDLQYRVYFDRPSPIYGFQGHIMSPTLKVQAGYLYFDWWDSNQAGHDRLVKRSMKVRFVEPRVRAS